MAGGHTQGECCRDVKETCFHQLGRGGGAADEEPWGMGTSQVGTCGCGDGGGWSGLEAPSAHWGVWTLPGARVGWRVSNQEGSGRFCALRGPPCGRSGVVLEDRDGSVRLAWQDQGGQGEPW